jgi:ribokinase
MKDAMGKTIGTELLVVGHLNLDHEMEVPFLPSVDRTSPVLDRHVFIGGPAGNIARWSAKLGLKVALSSFIGRDFPAEFTEILRKERVDVSRVSVRKGFLTPACWIARDRAGKQMTMIDQAAMEGTSDLPLSDLKGVGWVHLATGDPGFQLKVARAAKRLKIPVASDPAQEIHYRWSAKDLRELLSLSEMFFGNLSELEEAVRMLGLTRPQDIVKVVPLAIITMGAKGACAYTRRGTFRCPSAKVKRARGVTGAGDAFRGGFYSGWLRGEPLERCLELGTKAGAAVIRTPRSLFLPSLFGKVR